MRWFRREPPPKPLVDLTRAEMDVTFQWEMAWLRVGIKVTDGVVTRWASQDVGGAIVGREVWTAVVHLLRLISETPTEQTIALIDGRLH